jgi:hypothetical protein
VVVSVGVCCFFLVLLLLLLEVTCDCLQLLEGSKAKAVGAKDNGKGAVAEKGKAVLTPKQSELQEAEKALMDDLKHQASDV